MRKHELTLLESGGPDTPMEILILGNEDLRKVSETVSLLDPSLDLLISRMRATLALMGVGLAAPQVGIQRRVVLVWDGEEVREFLNPEIVGKSEECSDAFEGCLSIPKQQVLVRRSLSLTLEHDLRDGTRVRENFSDFIARIVQHEMDHLDGVLIVDREEQPNADRWLEDYYHAVSTQGWEFIGADYPLRMLDSNARLGNWTFIDEVLSKLDLSEADTTSLVAWLAYAKPMEPQLRNYSKLREHVRERLGVLAPDRVERLMRGR